MRIDKRVERILKATIMTLFGVDEADLPAYDEAMGTSTDDERKAAFRTWMEDIWGDVRSVPDVGARADDIYVLAGCVSPPINQREAHYLPPGMGTAGHSLTLYVSVQDVISDNRSKWIANITEVLP